MYFLHNLFLNLIVVQKAFSGQFCGAQSLLCVGVQSLDYRLDDIEEGVVFVFNTNDFVVLCLLFTFMQTMSLTNCFFTLTEAILGGVPA